MDQIEGLLHLLRYGGKNGRIGDDVAPLNPGGLERQMLGACVDTDVALPDSAGDKEIPGYPISQQQAYPRMGIFARLQGWLFIPIRSNLHFPSGLNKSIFHSLYTLLKNCIKSLLSGYNSISSNCL